MSGKKDYKILEIDDNTFLATSIANYRRQEIQGLMENPMTEQVETSTDKRK